MRTERGVKLFPISSHTLVVVRPQDARAYRFTRRRRWDLISFREGIHSYSEFSRQLDPFFNRNPRTSELSFMRKLISCKYDEPPRFHGCDKNLQNHRAIVDDIQANARVRQRATVSREIVPIATNTYGHAHQLAIRNNVRSKVHPVATEPSSVCRPRESTAFGSARIRKSHSSATVVQSVALDPSCEFSTHSLVV